MRIEWVYLPMGVALTLAIMATVLSIRRLRITNLLFAGAIGLEVILLAQLIIGLVAVAGAPPGVDVVVFVGYLIGCLLVPPAAVFWGLADASRWGTGVVAIGMAAVAFLDLRLIQIWQG
jgi:hypothetical protein